MRLILFLIWERCSIEKQRNLSQLGIDYNHLSDYPILNCFSKMGLSEVASNLFVDETQDQQGGGTGVCRKVDF